MNRYKQKGFSRKVTIASKNCATTRVYSFQNILDKSMQSIRFYTKKTKLTPSNFLIKKRILRFGFSYPIKALLLGGKENGGDAQTAKPLLAVKHWKADNNESK